MGGTAVSEALGTSRLLVCTFDVLLGSAPRYPTNQQTAQSVLRPLFPKLLIQGFLSNRMVAGACLLVDVLGVVFSVRLH